MYGLGCGAIVVMVLLLQLHQPNTNDPTDRPTDRSNISVLCVFPTVMVITFSSFHIQRPPLPLLPVGRLTSTGRLTSSYIIFHQTLCSVCLVVLLAHVSFSSLRDWR
uniref:Secreted protein n=1 Tax=Anopheles darlingi TaxID=43151 RepID=A0A2M4D7T6_ANODA